MSTKRFSILSIDDEEISQSIVEEFLKNEPYEVSFASSGHEALTKLKDHKPDLILLDIKMPDMDGLEVCEQIKNKLHYHDIPIVFLSGLSSAEERVAGYNAGGVDYITKPYEANELLSKIKNTLLNDQLAKERNKIDVEFAHSVTDLMNSQYQLEIILNFIKDNIRVNQLDLLAKQVRQCINSMGFTSTMHFHDNNEEMTYFHDDVAHPLEASIIKDNINAGHYVSINENCLININNVSILYKPYLELEFNHDKTLENLKLLSLGVSMIYECIQYKLGQ